MFTNQRPAVRQDDRGIHAACCGTNSWNAQQGSASVFINNRPAVRMGDTTKHCGGLGRMIEGSHNVIIGGSTTSGGGGGGGGGGGTGGGGGGGSQAQRSGAAASGPGAAAVSSSRDNPVGHQPREGSAGEGATSESPAEEPDTFTLWAALEAINGGKLLGESVRIVDPDTNEVVGRTEVDSDGNVLFSVPENKPYHLVIEPDDDDLPLDEQGLESLAHSHLAVAFFDTSGLPLPAGIPVKVRGNGVDEAYETDVAGALEAQLEPGTYEIEIKGQTFFADTLRGIDLEHEASSQYEYIIELDEDDSDDDIERAREHRMTASDLEDELDG